ncbi:hypothetical protein BASA81_012361 [Batrachochytrium salamandrivorans]|nr:hypothetical protein BASA81_012361 [Batrachochytrium salamandrivorans]
MDSPESWKLFVGQVPRSMRLEELVVQFGVFGELQEVFVIKDQNTGMSKGCCFVRFRHRASAERCMEVLNDKIKFPGGSQVLQVSFTSQQQQPPTTTTTTTTAVGGGRVRSFQPAAKPSLSTSTTGDVPCLGGDVDSSPPVATTPSTQSPVYPKLFVGGLTHSTSELQLAQLFSHYGKVVEVIVLRFPNGQSKLSGFVKFSNDYEANLAIEGLTNRYSLPGSPRPLTVRLAAPTPTEHKLFVGHLPANFNEDQTSALFAKYGKVIEVHVMRDARTGLSKGSAFVKFASRGEAENAITGLNNSTAGLGGGDNPPSPLKVSFALSKLSSPLPSALPSSSSSASASPLAMSPSLSPMHAGSHHLLGISPVSPSHQYTTFYHPVSYFAPPPPPPPFTPPPPPILQ